MRTLALALLCVLVAACFSKPPFTGDPDIADNAPARIATGNRHACRIADGRVICWGNNDHGQLGTRTDVDDFSGVPGLASMTDGWTNVATGVQHTCGVRDGAVYCWGENSYRQAAPLASADPSISITPVMLPSVSPVERVFAGSFATCAITAAHEAYCWGDLAFEIMAPAPAMPVLLGDGTTTFHQVSIGDDHACAIADGGRVHCWGETAHGQTGQPGSGSPMLRPFAEAAPIASAERFQTVSAGHDATCGTTVDGKLVCWGTADHGHLGTTPPTQGGHPPLVIDEGPGWTTVALGFNHVCAVRDRAVYCYGTSYFGALGSGSFDANLEITSPVAGLPDVVQVAANVDYTCALAADGETTRCWGSNSKGELGNGEASRKVDPTEVQLPPGMASQIVAGNNHACALVGGEAYCWGLNTDRQIGAMSGQPLHATPERVPGYTFTRLAAGGLHTCGILTNDRRKIACWGDNVSHQLGSTNTNAVNEVTLPMGTEWTSVAAGSRMSCGINDAGRLYCWGLRAGTSTAIPAPAEYPAPGAGHLWLSISIGSDFAVALTEGGGQRHVYSIADKTNPMKLCAAHLPANHVNPQMPSEILGGIIPSSMAVPTIAAAQSGGSHTCMRRTAVTTNVPTVTCFGVSADGQTGGPSACGDTPQTRDVGLTVPDGWPVPTIAAQDLFTASDHSCALDATGLLWCWGMNSNFELGRTSPGAVPKKLNDTKWTAIAGGTDHTCGIADTGRVYCWGENQYGQVGDGTSYEPSPVASGVLP